MTRASLGPLFAVLDRPEGLDLGDRATCDAHQWNARWQCEQCAANHPAFEQLLTRLDRHLIASQAAPGARQNIARYILNGAVSAGKDIPDSPAGGQIAWEWLIACGGKLRMDHNQLRVDIPRVVTH